LSNADERAGASASPQFDYQRYLASREWAVLKRMVRERSYGACERCGAGRLDPNESNIAAVHHLTYERIGHELLEDLLGVCAGCHAWLSGLSDIDPVVEYLRGSGDTSDELDLWLGLSPRPASYLDWAPAR
jgi:hypothetical protein